jgi:hypothetical protein
LLVAGRDFGDGGDRVADVDPVRVILEAREDFAVAVDDCNRAISAFILCGKFGPRRTAEVEA